MNIKTNSHGGEEVAGTKFLTWAMLVVAAGVVFAATTEFSASPQTQTVQTTTEHRAS